MIVGEEQEQRRRREGGPGLEMAEGDEMRLAARDGSVAESVT